MSSYLDLPVDLPEAAKDNIKRHVRNQGKQPDKERLRKAAVFIATDLADGHWQLIYTLRSSLLHDHSGRVSLVDLGGW